MFEINSATLLAIAHFAVAIPACVHILLTKDQEPVAMGWVALVLLSPFIGSGFYVLFGINRVQRQAQRIRGRPQPEWPPLHFVTSPASIDEGLTHDDLIRATSGAQTLPMTAGNAVTPLVDGDQAFPAMIAAIERAQHSVALSVYIFDRDKAGEMFNRALIAAHGRGVAVRVLIDDLGQFYSTKAIAPDLERNGVELARFMRRSLRRVALINLRNHRKLLIIDGQEAFIGGMNIRHGHMVKDRPRHPVRDIHFHVVGPVIDQMSDLFEEDWHYATGHDLSLPRHQASAHESGTIFARLVPDGPDMHFEKLLWVMMGAIGASKASVRIMTPYFLPGQILAAALRTAAQRGVAVELIVPARSNIPFVMDWAMQSHFGALLEHGINIWLSPAPFDHSKVLVVDGKWSLIGSTNWDPRSLRLNFEANLECFDAELASKLTIYFESRKAESVQIDINTIRTMPRWMVLRNNIVRLLSPYL